MCIRDRMRGDAGFKTWLYSIAINEMKQHHRKNNKYNSEVSNSEYVQSYSINQALDEKLDIEKLLSHLSNDEAMAVSYTHLDVYKRQILTLALITLSISSIVIAPYLNNVTSFSNTATTVLSRPI